jgi:hypothetical protein
MTPDEVKSFTRNFYVGPICYTAALLLALVSGIASLVLILAVAVFFAVGTKSPKAVRDVHGGVVNPFLIGLHPESRD